MMSYIVTAYLHTIIASMTNSNSSLILRPYANIRMAPGSRLPAQACSSNDHQILLAIIWGQVQSSSCNEDIHTPKHTTDVVLSF